MRLLRAWTDADGVSAEPSEADAVFSVDAMRALLEIVEVLLRRGVIDGTSGVEAREGPERGAPCPSKRVSTCAETNSKSCGDGSRSGCNEP
jgi:hypothetical protein